MQVSQSLQSAPFNNLYTFTNTSEAIHIYDTDISSLNSYKGWDDTIWILSIDPVRWMILMLQNSVSFPSFSAAFQQATSVVSDALRSATQNGVRTDTGSGGNFAVYGTEFTPGLGGEAVWVNNGQPAWKLTSAALVAGEWLRFHFKFDLSSLLTSSLSLRTQTQSARLVQERSLLNRWWVGSHQLKSTAWLSADALLFDNFSSPFL